MYYGSNGNIGHVNIMPQQDPKSIQKINRYRKIDKAIEDDN